MIDISTLQYNRVREAIKAKCKNSGQLDTDTPPALPYLVHEQIDNPIVGSRSEAECPEHTVAPVIQIKVYTNGDTSLVDNKDIMELANDQMISNGFIRTFGPQQIKNVLDTSIICFVAKYKAQVDEDGSIYNP